MLAAPAGGAWNNPWEERAGRSPLAAFAETLQRSLFHPVAFFRGTAPESGAGAALFYAVIVGTFSIAVFFLWQSALANQFSAERGGRFLSVFGNRGALAAFLIVVPAMVALQCLVTAALEHLTLAVLGGANGTYRTTLKAVCYSTSALAFSVFPLCGMLVGGLWQVVVQVIGIRELHRTSTARASLAWLLPLLIAVCLVGMVFLATIFGLLRLLLGIGDGKLAV